MLALIILLNVMFDLDSLVSWFKLFHRLIPFTETTFHQFSPQSWFFKDLRSFQVILAFSFFKSFLNVDWQSFFMSFQHNLQNTIIYQFIKFQ